MSYLLPHLTNGYAVDQAIMTVRVWLVSIGDNGRLFFFFSFEWVRAQTRSSISA